MSIIDKELSDLYDKGFDSGYNFAYAELEHNLKGTLEAVEVILDAHGYGGIGRALKSAVTPSKRVLED